MKLLILGATGATVRGRDAVLSALGTGKSFLLGFPIVSRADVADLMLRELTARAWIRKVAVIST